ncbi:RNA polymerase sigma factor [Rhodonellum sp.]|uniref:RNA polymerase sigma factor n=1 Tax=Rhodonellum sp. TaxID=2231180 RepID=UPI002719A0E6|nr:sigma-70 family RNA polymerase sigma factor [Rhodonellum sp.]MDO9552226.1 sigma-70 family RNA polymerase sigma factor [Rhodonellum sp.]
MSLQDRFTAEIKANHRIIRKVCLIYAGTKDDQEDLFQECLYNAWKAFPDFRMEAKFSTWLYKVALNTALYHQRKNKSPALEVGFEMAYHLSTEQEDNDHFDQLYQAISILNGIEKSVILLHLEGMSYREIGEITGFTETNIGAKLTRIKEKLKKIIIKDGF